MPQFRYFAVTVLGLAIAYLSYALLAVVDEVRQVRKDLPALLDQVQTIEKDVDIDAWLTFLNGVKEQIPELLVRVDAVNATVDKVNGQIPDILLEVKNIREQTIPPVLERVKSLQTETIPPVLKEVQLVRTETIPPVLHEVELIRTKTVPPILDEVENVRLMIPPTLTRVENLVNQAQKAGEKASSGAVKGILLSPFNILGGAVGLDGDDSGENKSEEKKD